MGQVNQLLPHRKLIPFRVKCSIKYEIIDRNSCSVPALMGSLVSCVMIRYVWKGDTLHPASWANPNGLRGPIQFEPTAGFYRAFYLEGARVSGLVPAHRRICQPRWERSAAAVAESTVRRPRRVHHRATPSPPSPPSRFIPLVEARRLQQLHGSRTSGALIG